MGRALPAVLAVGLAVTGLWLDQACPVSQAALFLSLWGASWVGALAAFAWRWPRSDGKQRLLLGFAAFVAWRLSYFPIMVFSGHVASIGEWLLVGSGLLPIVIYPIFLLSLAGLHAAAGLAAGWLLAPPRRALHAPLGLAFGLATLISFSTLDDLTWLPDRSLSLEDSVPAPRGPQRNPYLPRLAEPGYAPPQRVLLIAAGVTYSLIPETPWAGTVKGVLEGEFEANPRASTQARVREHYLAYRSAHERIGCRDLEQCTKRCAANDTTRDGPPRS